MSKKMYAYVGNWNFHPADKGISVFQYFPEDGSMELIENVYPEIAAGQIWLHPEKPVLYVVNEKGDLDGKMGGGGYVLAFAIDEETGKLTMISNMESLCTEPCYVVVDKSRRHVLVSQHADPFYVTKLVKHADGSWGNQIIMEDAGLLLIGLNEDGSLGEIQDVYITESNGGLGREGKKLVDPVTGHVQLTRVISRQHSVMPSPSGNIYVVCDKGMDRVYTFGVDDENDELKLLDTYVDDLGVFPRYSSFHPSLPVFYTNNERKCEAHVFRYDDNTGKIDLIQKVELLNDEYRGKEYAITCRPMGAQDVLVHPNGKVVYYTVEGGDNLIITLKVKEDGLLELAQNIDCQGTMPRGICLSPDGRFLLSGNLTSGDVTVFFVDEEGMLSWTGKKYEAVSPSAIRIYEVEE
ncbi:MAG: lactonase family protein [Lachnospiraceae bacterium]|nr:lactonase family protein [Lachnospiraceae bacterium]